MNDTCPDDRVLGAGTVCRPAAGVCDAAESCDGISPTCPFDAKRLDVCRPAAGACDVAESCDGLGDHCPADAFRPAGEVCREAAGPCDLPETCSGSSVSCPLDDKRVDTCRPAASDCDVPESCDGVGDLCPPDMPKPDQSPCNDGNPCTQLDVCENGVCRGYEPLEDGSPCDAGNKCTQLDICHQGACRGLVPVSCDEAGECQNAGTCDPATGACVYEAKADETPCSGGTCRSGRCVAKPAEASQAGGCGCAASRGGGIAGLVLCLLAVLTAARTRVGPRRRRAR